MRQRRMWMLVAILVLCGQMKTMGQIDPKVTEILKKSEQAMNSPKGIEMTMTMDVKMLVKLSGSTMTVAQKGDKERTTMVLKILGKELKIEHGFDGTQRWSYQHINLSEKDLKALKKKGKEVKDTLTIERATKKSKSDADFDFDLDKSYKKATMKLNGQYYELTFTDPIDKDDPGKMVMKIDKDKFYVHEVKAKESGATMTMTVTKIKIGVSDDVFRLNLSDYPGAVVVRK